MKKRNYFIIAGFLSMALIGWLTWKPLAILGASIFTETPLNQNTATTTLTTLTAGSASSSVVASIGDADQNYLYVFFVASSSASTLQWSYEYSRDTSSTSDWYGEDVASSTPGVAYISHASSSVVHRLNTGLTATTTRLIKLPDSVGKFIRVNFSVFSGNGQLWADVVPKKLIPH